MCGRVEKEEEGYQYTVVGKPVAYQERQSDTPPTVSLLHNPYAHTSPHAHGQAGMQCTCAHLAVSGQWTWPTDAQSIGCFINGDIARFFLRMLPSREGLCFENSKFISKVNFTGREELPPINDMLEAFAAFAMTPHRSMLSSALDLQASCINEQAVNEI
ncbi:unnamed protein product [Brugia pahangi]|uniref:Uncharacterized protein n=1 Tax=Brugia pahangi TaxID=6280 RepID=A0A0N4SX96_BRUPA|nr:unnamed protein product [Brugia pahangi]